MASLEPVTLPSRHWSEFEKTSGPTDTLVMLFILISQLEKLAAVIPSSSSERDQTQQEELKQCWRPKRHIFALAQVTSLMTCSTGTFLEVALVELFQVDLSGILVHGRQMRHRLTKQWHLAVCTLPGWDFLWSMEVLPPAFQWPQSQGPRCPLGCHIPFFSQFLVLPSKESQASCTVCSAPGSAEHTGQNQLRRKTKILSKPAWTMKPSTRVPHSVSENTGMLGPTKNTYSVSQSRPSREEYCHFWHLCESHCLNEGNPRLWGTETKTMRVKVN